MGPSEGTEVTGKRTVSVVACIAFLAGLPSCDTRKERPAGGGTKPGASVRRTKRSGSLFPVIHKTGKWCYIDNTGKVVIEPRFERAFEFAEGLALVEQGDTWGYIDVTGKVAFELKKPFDWAGPFSEGLAWIRADGKHGYIDRTGKLAIEPRFDGARGFSAGLAAVQLGKKRGYIDKTGEFVIQPQFIQACDFFEGLAAVDVGEKWGYIDKTGDFVIEPRFKWACAFSEGRAGAMVEGGLYGFIDTMGNFVVEPRFRVVGKFSKGMAVVGVGDSPDWYGYVDRTGEFVIEPRFKRAGAFSEGLAGVKIGDKCGYIDRTGKVVIEPQWNAVRSFRGGLAKVLIGDQKWDSDKWFYIDRTGKRTWDVPGPMWPAILGPVKTRRRIPKTPRWWLRLRALDPDGKPLSGVQVWVDEVIDAQVGMGSSPVGWREISRSGMGTAAARTISWTKASGFVTPRGGVVKVGPFRGYVEFRFRLYHPDYAALDVCASTRRYWFDDKRLLQVSDLKLPRGHTISGVVKGPDGRPFKDAWVAAQPTGRLGLAVGWIRTARTNADGCYVLRGLERFHFKVAAWTERHLPVTAEADLSPSMPVRQQTGEAGRDEWAVRTLDFRLSAGR